jgi:hypothetical protein
MGPMSWLKSAGDFLGADHGTGLCNGSDRRAAASRFDFNGAWIDEAGWRIWSDD